MRGEGNTDHPGDGKVAGVWRDRKRACAKVLYDAVDRVGGSTRRVAARRNFEFFDAPHVAFIAMDEVFGMQSAADVGMFSQTLMLAMTAHGVSSCAKEHFVTTRISFVRRLEWNLRPKFFLA